MAKYNALCLQNDSKYMPWVSENLKSTVNRISHSSYCQFIFSSPHLFSDTSQSLLSVASGKTVIPFLMLSPVRPTYLLLLRRHDMPTKYPFLSVQRADFIQVIEMGFSV